MRDYGEPMSLSTALGHLREASLILARDLDRRDPKKFYVVIPFSDDYGKKELADLSRGVLDGVQGISEKSEIILQWHGMARDAVLVMDAKELVKLNQLSRVQYTNPEYLASDGMAALYRIFDKKKDESYGIAGNLVDYLTIASSPKRNRGQDVLDEARALADRIDAASAKLASALAALPFDDPYDKRDALRSVTKQLDENDFKFFLKESGKASESLRAVADHYDGLTKRIVDIYLNRDEIGVHNAYLEVAAEAPTAEARALDYGWTADQAAALQAAMTALRDLVQTRSKVDGLRTRALEELDLMSRTGAVGYALQRGTYRYELQKDFEAKGTADIKTVKGLAKRLHQVGLRVRDTEDVPLSTWQVLARRAMERIGSTYDSEGEWLVKDKKLKVPKGSALYVTASSLPPDIEKKRQAGTLTEQDKFIHRSEIERADNLDRLIKEYKLDQRYRVFRLSAEKLHKAKLLYWERPKKTSASAIQAAIAIPLRDARRSLLLMQNAAQALVKVAKAWTPAMEEIARLPYNNALEGAATDLAEVLEPVLADLAKGSAVDYPAPAAVVNREALRAALPAWTLEKLQKAGRRLRKVLAEWAKEFQDADIGYAEKRGWLSQVEAKFLTQLVEKLPLLEQRVDADAFAAGLKSLLGPTSEAVPESASKEETLYHASINARGIVQKGFAAEVPKGGGLGGSQSDKAGKPAISFTYDLHAAKEIARSLKEAVSIAKGEYTRAKLLRLLEEEDKNALRKALQVIGDKGQDDPTHLFLIYSYFVGFATKRFDPRYFGDRRRMAEAFAKADPRAVGVVEAVVNAKHPDVLHLPGERELRVPPKAVLRVTKLIR